MLRSVLLLTATVGLTGCAAHRIHWIDPESLKAKPPYAEKAGILYALPRTTVDIDLVVSRTELRRGKLADDLLKSSAKGEYLLRLDLDEKRIPGGTPVHVYNVVKFDMAAGSMPDPDNVFFVELPAGASQDTAVNMEFTELGIPTKVESDIANRTLDNLGQILSSVTAAASKYAAFAGAGPQQDPVENIVLAVEEVRRKRAALFENALVSDALVLERQALELTKLEAQLLGNFVQLKVTTWIAQFRIVPSASVATYHVMSVVERSDVEKGTQAGVATVAATPVIHGPPRDWTTTSNGDRIELHVVRGDRKDTLAGTLRRATGELDRTKPHGLYYRIPEPATLVLTYKGETKAQLGTLVAQLGEVAALPSHFNNTASKLTAALYAQTGALKSIGAQNKAIQPETLARFGTALENVAQAANSRERAQAAERAARTAELRANLELANTILTGALAGPAPQ